MSEQKGVSVAEKGIDDFESMNLQPGTRLQFFTHRNHKPVHYVSTVIGLEQNTYLLLKQPRDQGVLLTFIDGEKLTVRVFSGTAICSFDTTVIKTLTHPLYCLCVAFPRSIRSKQLRRDMRIKVALDAMLHVAGKEEKVRLSNLSATGCLAHADKPLGTVDEAVSITFSLPFGDGDDGHAINARATIRNITEQQKDDANSAAIGLEFEGVGGTESLIIRNHVYEMLLDGRQNIV